MTDGFVPCVCHKGVTWDRAELTAEGHCPQYFYEVNNAEHIERSERQAAYDQEWANR